MQKYLLTYFTFFVLSGCAGSEEKSIDYVKVIVFGEAGHVTAYNKGIAVAAYAYYEPATDSLLYVNKESSDTSLHETFTTRFHEIACRDTFINIIKALEKYEQGNMVDTTIDYCSDPIYLEYGKQGKIYHHYFIEGDDTLTGFITAFFLLPDGDVKKQTAKNISLELESEGVNAMKRLGEYDKRESPYTPVFCAEGIDKTKIVGIWRMVYDEGFNHRNRFTRLTVDQKGQYFFESINGGIAERKSSIYKFRITDDNFIVGTSQNGTFRHPILKLTDSCFVVKLRDDIMMFNRL